MTSVTPATTTARLRVLTEVDVATAARLLGRRSHAPTWWVMRREPRPTHAARPPLPDPSRDHAGRTRTWTAGNVDHQVA
jgi:hypothetical protein